MLCAQVQLAELQAKSDTAQAAATAELQKQTAELDSIKNKLLTERATNARHMERSAEVCLQGKSGLTRLQQHSMFGRPNCPSAVAAASILLVKMLGSPASHSRAHRSRHAPQQHWQLKCWLCLTLLPPSLFASCRKWTSPGPRRAR